MSARTRTISRPTLQALGDRLDTAERALASYDGTGSEFDFEDKRGHLQHHGERCPICILYNARAEYIGEARKPVFIADNAARKRHDRTITSENLRDFYDAMLSAQAARDAMHLPGADVCYSERERIDSACAAELAECVFETLAEKHQWRIRNEAARRRAHHQLARADKAAGIVRRRFKIKQRTRHL